MTYKIDIGELVSYLKIKLAIEFPTYNINILKDANYISSTLDKQDFGCLLYFKSNIFKFALSETIINNLIHKNNIDYTQAIDTIFKSLKSAIIQLNEDSDRRDKISHLSYLDTVVAEGRINQYVTTLNKFEVSEKNKENSERAKIFNEKYIEKFDNGSNENNIRFVFVKKYIEKKLKAAFNNIHKITLTEDINFKKTDKKIGLILEVVDALIGINIKSSIDLDVIEDLSAFDINVLDVQVNGFKNAIESIYKNQSESMLSESDEGLVDDIKEREKILQEFELMAIL